MRCRVAALPIPKKNYTFKADRLRERHEARFQEAAEGDAMIEQVADGIAELAGRWFIGLMGLRPRDQLVEDGFAPVLAYRQLGVRIVVADLTFDLVELLVGGDRQRRALVACLERLHVVAPCVHVAAALDELGILPEAGVEQVRGVGDGVALALQEHVLGAHLARLLSDLLCRRGVDVGRHVVADVAHRARASTALIAPSEIGTPTRSDSSLAARRRLT